MIEYIYNNLPKKIVLSTIEEEDIIYFWYDAAGQKLRKQTRTDGAIVATTDYIGSFVYENNFLQYILTDEGRIVYDRFNDTYQYQYFLKDHLGNTRILFDENGTVLQDNSYYPFGMAIDALCHSENFTPDNNYLYNGKELQDDFGLGWYDYGARFYDAAQCQWTTPDPMAEAYYSYSSYSYTLNNPVAVTDANGKWSVSNHHKMTMDALSTVGIGGRQAHLIAYYASVYADNPGELLKWNNVAHPNYMMGYLSNVDHVATMNSQVTSWRPGSPGMNNNIRHSMRSNWEADAFEKGLPGGISKRDAQLRGMKYGWDNIFSSAQKGHLKDMDLNDKGMQEFGVGAHALQDGYGHAGVSMDEHSLYDDVYGDMGTSQKMTESAIVVHKLMSGDWSNLEGGGKLTIDMKGMSSSQKEQVMNKVKEYLNQ